MSAVVGADSMGWRYDPIFTGKIHSVEWHISEFEKMAEILAGYTKTCVISFIDIYKKVERNFPEAKSVRIEDRAMIGKAFVKIHETTEYLEMFLRNLLLNEKNERYEKN